MASVLRPDKARRVRTAARSSAVIMIVGHDGMALAQHVVRTDDALRRML